MPKEIDIPRPAPHTQGVVDLVGIVLETIPVVGGTINKTLEVWQKHKIEVALAEIVAAVKRQGLEVLDEEDVQYFIPAALRFAEQVRIGEYDYNLKILAEIIANDLKERQRNYSDFGRFTRKLEYLSFDELTVLAMVGTLENQTPVGESDLFWVSAKDLMAELSDERLFNYSKVAAALSVLQSRGLIVPQEEPIISKIAGAYRLSDDGHKMVAAAKKVN